MGRKKKPVPPKPVRPTFYAYVNVKTGKFWGVPVPMKFEEYLQYKKDTGTFMKKKGYVLKPVIPSKDSFADHLSEIYEPVGSKNNDEEKRISEPDQGDFGDDTGPVD